MTYGPSRTPYYVLQTLRSRFIDLLSSVPLARVAIVAVQHLVTTTVPLFEALVELGADPADIFVLGKIYSSNQEAVAQLRNLGINVLPGEAPRLSGDFEGQFSRDINQLWKMFMKSKHTRERCSKIVVLDDGGFCLSGIPGSVYHEWQISGVEQTTSGLEREPLAILPVVEVASSAAKRLLEPPLIAEATLKSIASRNFVRKGSRCGIIGVGSVGSALARQLVEDGSEVLAYDLNGSVRATGAGATYLGSAMDIVSRSDVVFGCTGRNISSAQWLDSIAGDHVLASCSSSDVEFRDLLRWGSDHREAREDVDVLSDLIVQSQGVKFIVLRGGFPINFTGAPTSVPEEDIQMTRALLLGAVVQASYYCGQKPYLDGRRMKNHIRVRLDESIQKFVAQLWFKERPARYERFAREISQIFGHEDSIGRSSLGIQWKWADVSSL